MQITQVYTKRIFKLEIIVNCIIFSLDGLKYYQQVNSKILLHIELKSKCKKLQVLLYRTFHNKDILEINTVKHVKKIVVNQSFEYYNYTYAIIEKMLT